MQTELSAALLATDAGSRADGILRSCVHCGFCNATCPTYQLLGDELDGPRGRIYLLKDLLETQRVSATAVTHLDRCLTCRACETTCPSGVSYGELLEIGRDYIARHHRRPWLERLQRDWLQRVVAEPRRFRRWARLGNLLRPFLPRHLRGQLPRLRRPARRQQEDVAPAGARQALLLDGCVQQVATPEVNGALRRLLERRGVEVHSLGGCCGALSLHLGETDRARERARQLLDALAPRLETVEAVVSSASGCGVTLAELPRLFQDDAHYGALAARLADKLMDATRFVSLVAMTTEPLEKVADVQRVAVQAPCSLQHGLRQPQAMHKVLEAAGYELVPVAEAHLCCGSAGSYAVLQPELAGALRRRKLDQLLAGDPDVIATANVGCQIHLAGDAVPVRHWLELVC